MVPVTDSIITLSGVQEGLRMLQEDVKAAYAARNKELVPIDVHGTTVAVDWDCCIADGSCIEVVQ
jgi:NAD-dependent dihydropyrimidine dehydrogenase PreA subunit